MPLLPLFDAAQALGISPATLRKRLKAGTAQGERRPTRSGFTWWVDVAPVPGAEGAQVGAQPAKEGAQVGDQAAIHVGDQVGDQGVPTDYLALQEAVSRLETHNADLRDTNAHLTDELASRRREVQELHVLLGRMQTSLPPPSADQRDESRIAEGPIHQDAPGPPPAGRSWWRRLAVGLGLS